MTFTATRVFEDCTHYLIIQGTVYRLLKAVLFFMCRYLIVMLLTSGKNSLQCTILIYCDPKTQAHTFYIIYIKKRSFNRAFKHTTTLFNFLLQKNVHVLSSYHGSHRNALSSMHILLSLLANILHSKYLSAVCALSFV